MRRLTLSIHRPVQRGRQRPVSRKRAEDSGITGRSRTEDRHDPVGEFPLEHAVPYFRAAGPLRSHRTCRRWSTTGTDSEAAPASDDAAAPEPVEPARTTHLRQTVSPELYIALSRDQQSPPGQQWGGDHGPDLVRRSSTMEWRERSTSIRDRSGIRSERHARVAGFPSGEAYKVGKAKPYFRLQRAFVRQRFDLGGESQPVSPGANELGGALTADNVTVTVGKFSVVDIFDTNLYAHDPRGDFLNWSVIDAAAFDYAADAWGYTVGGRSNGRNRGGRFGRDSSISPMFRTARRWSRASRNSRSSGKSKDATTSVGTRES